MKFTNTTRKKTFQKLSLLTLLTLSLFLGSSCQMLVTPIAGNFDGDPKELKENLDKEDIKNIDEAFKSLEGKCPVDFHVHAVGIGANNSGLWVNPKMSSFFNFKEYIKYNVYMNASGITDVENADQQYMDRLAEQVTSEKRIGKILLFAFDYHYKLDGSRDKENSTFYVPNQYVYDMAKKYPEQMIPAISIHPYRKDAVERLEFWAKKGVKFIKWLPNSMHIDPARKEIIPFYKMMAKYDMALISHTGHEKAVEGEEFQELGNPLRLKLALDHGAKIVMSHLASLGECSDFDNQYKPVFCFDLFWRLMKTGKYKGQLYGEISATTLHTRLGKPLLDLLEHPEYHSYFINGSDYPLPAINLLYRTSQYLKEGYITKSQEKTLNKVYKYNPLLFNFLTKRMLSHPKTKAKLSDQIFTGSDLFSCNQKL
tara:strand:- start:10604 stop:11881 length:1278 start_codon:yes stop_codon:yes gene_type:complete